MARLRKIGITLLKLVISGLLLYFISTKIDFKEVAEVLQHAKPTYIFLGLLFLVASKIIGAFRLNLYFQQLPVYITQISNLKLYLLGMFYNMFLPGGIGGDAYKGYLIKKKFSLKTKKVVSVLFLDRLSGLVLICIYICLLSLSIRNKYVADLGSFALISIPLGIGLFWLFTQRLFSYTLPVFWKALGLSTMVQLLQLVSVLCILKSLEITTNEIPYLFVFLISSLVSVIPLTIGGIGSRELTFLYGASLLTLNESTAIGVSVLFFLMTALISLAGIYYLFKPLVLEEDTSKN